MKINKLLESQRTDDYLSIKEINWLKDNPGQEIKKTHYKVSYNDYVNANTNEPMGGHFTVIENRGRDTTRVNGVQELKDYIVRRYNKYFEESISRSEPALHFQGKSSHTFTKDKKWEVDFDEAGNILARTRHGKPYYFKGHINDKVNNFPYTDEDNIILAAREQHGLKFGNKEVKEGYSHFEFTSGSNPYIAKTKSEAERIKRNRGDSVKYVGNINGIDYYKVDDSEKDLFRVDDLDEASIPRNATRLRATHRYGDKETMELSKDGTYWRTGNDNKAYPSDYLRKYYDVEVLDTDPNYKPNRTKPEYVVQGNYGYGWEDLTASDNQAEARNDLKAYRENETGVPHRLITRRVPVTENLKEAFKPSDSGIQSVKCYNRYNYTIQELRVDNDKKTFERGNFTAGKADKKTKNRQEYEDIVDSLKELGYTEIKSGYNSMRNKSRKGNPTSVEEGYELSPRIDYNPNHLRDDEGKIMADKWYGSKWPDDEVGIEQLKGITLDDALKDRKILDHCDTQVRERVYAQLDKYIPLSKDSPMFKEVNESSEGFQKEFYNGYVILKNRAGEGWDIYSYDGTPEKVKKAYLEDEGYATLKDAKAEIDRLNKESNSMNEGHQVQTYKGYELDWNEDGIDPEEGTANFEVYIVKNGKELTDERGSALTFHGFRQAREYIDNLPPSPEELREKNIELLANLRDDLNKYFNSEADLKDNYEACFYYQNNTAEFTIEYWDSHTRNTNLLLVVYYLDTDKWELSFKDWDDSQEGLVDYSDSGKGYNDLIDTIDNYSLSVFVVFGFDVQSLKIEDSIDKYSGGLNESTLKVGDNVYVTTCKKNGKVKEINGEHITVETDNGKDPIRVDTYYENEVKKLDEAHYGGAFDIADDQYFTRDDLNDFAEEVLNHINETFKTPFDVSSCYIDNGILELCVTNDEYGDYIYSEKIDMRKIKEPWHLKRAYAFEFASQLINDITQSNDGLIESVSSSSHEFDDDVDDLSYYYDDETFKDNLENSPYTEIASKSVTDSDGFITDYTMYMNINTGEYVFVFGDKDVYSPEDGYFDWECDTKEEAEEWFNSYNGFDDVDDDIDWLGEDVEKSPIVHKKSDGSYMVANENGDGYVAYNKDDECVGNITASNENEAKNKFNSNQFDE